MSSIAACPSIAESVAHVASHEDDSLLLHVDINGTVTPIDSVDPEATEELVNMFLAKYVYGRLDESGGWVHEPASRPGEVLPNTHTYYTHARLGAGKHHAYTFTHANQPGEHLAHLAEELRTYYAGATPSPASDETSDNVVAPARSLFPSFTRLLHAHPTARLVFRTFGHDARRIVASVTDELTRASLPPRVFAGYRLHRVAPDADSTNSTHTTEPLFALHAIDEHGVESTEATVTGDAAALGAFLDAHATDAYILDDYHYWHSRGRPRAAGKPIFPSSRRLVAFDDNACMSLPQEGVTSGRAKFVHVDPLRALCDDEYFLHAIRDAGHANTTKTTTPHA